ncbi:MAG: hypothetical protein ACKPB8_11570, partial [Alphaproteobacteria bacterium]
MNLWLDAFVPAFALLGLGALLRRILLPLDAVWAGMEKLIYWVLLPSLILSALAALDPASLPLGAMAFTIWGALAIGTLISMLRDSSMEISVPIASAPQMVKAMAP